MRAYKTILTIVLVWLCMSAAAQTGGQDQPAAGLVEPADSTAGLFAADSLAVPEGYELADTVIFIPSLRVDTTLAGKNIFYLMPSASKGDAADVRIYQSASIVSAMNKSFESNISRPYTGYRVRIFFDNRQSARQDSEQMVETFEKMYPGIPAYRSYVNPYFKITVGDFRTKSEAMSFLQRIIGAFPKAFIVKENIEYPVLDTDSLVRADTVRFLRKIAEDTLPAEEVTL